jgi:hypothetical protein
MGAHSSRLSCSLARANSACLLQNVCQLGQLTQRQAWGIQDIPLICPIGTIHSDAVPTHACGRDGTGPAWASEQIFVDMPDFACFKILTL